MESSQPLEKTDLEEYFNQFAKNIVGQDFKIKTQYGSKPLLYADWIASGRLYADIENTMRDVIGPMVANTHSFSSETGKASTYAYRHARQIIKDHVHADQDDILVTTGTGMTGAVVRFQRIIGLCDHLSNGEKPVVFVTHMEHHSNQISWMETNADVVIMECNAQKLVCPTILEKYLNQYKDRKVKIGAFTAASNVTGIVTPYYELAEIMHRHGGYCFVDFAASAPYVKIDMHPANPSQKLDAIAFSPHKFLGGPGSAGVLVFNKDLYNAACPDVPGGGNVKWTTPWGTYTYYEDIETKEDGGTPGFLQVMRAALAMQLKDKMRTELIKKREEELVQYCFEKLQSIPGLSILGSTHVTRIGCISFIMEGIHYNLVVRLLNDRFGIQVRGGWSCASTYSHYLLDIDQSKSEQIMKGINQKNLSEKPGWVRLSLHPTLSNKELDYICEALSQIQAHIDEWKKDYTYNSQTNEFDSHMQSDQYIIDQVENWFEI